MLRQRFNKNKYNIIMWFIIALFFLIPISKIVNYNQLFAIDPWLHMSLTQNLEPEHLFWYNIALNDKEESVHYPTFMRTLLYEYHLITNTDYIQIYKYFGFVMKFFLLLVILIFIRRFVLRDKKNTYILPVIACLFLWHNYFWTRAWITFPENFVLVLHWMLLFFTTLYLHEQKNKHLFFIIFFASLSIYYHNPSFVIVMFILLWFTIALLYKQKWTGLWKLLIIWIFTILLSLPVFRILVIEYLRQLHENIWSNIQTYWTIAKILPPLLKDYIWFSSILIIIFSLLWCSYLLSHNRNKETQINYILFLPLLFLFIGVFILTNWVRFNISVPIDRMQWYFIIPLMIISSFGLIFLFRNYNSVFKLSIFSFMFILSILTINNSSWWFKLWRGEPAAGQYLISNYSPTNKYFFATWVSFYELQFPYYNNIISDYSNLKKWDYTVFYGPCPPDKKVIYQTGSMSVCVF